MWRHNKDSEAANRRSGKTNFGDRGGKADGAGARARRGQPYLKIFKLKPINIEGVIHQRHRLLAPTRASRSSNRPQPQAALETAVVQMQLPGKKWELATVRVRRRLFDNGAPTD
ncbi:unnamed protein product, partial [Pleuronectes platessa]